MAFPLVQATSTQQLSGTAAPLAFAANVTAGNLLVVAVLNVGSGSGLATMSVADSLGNTYVSIGTQQVFGASNKRLSLWYVKNAKGGACTVTPSPSIANHVYMSIHEYAGMDRSSPLDQALGATATGTAPTASVTTTFKSELVFGVAATVQSSTLTAGGTFAAEQNAFFSGRDQMKTEDKSVLAAGVNAADWTVSPSSEWAAFTATFKVANYSQRLPIQQAPRRASFY